MDLSKLKMPLMGFAGPTREEYAYDAAAYLVKRVDWLSSGVYESAPNPASDPAFAGLSYQVRVKLEDAAQVIHDQTPSRTQERK